MTAAMALCTSALADDALFKEHVYGAPFSKYSNQAGYYDCSVEIGATALCIDDVKFVGHAFTAALLFRSEEHTSELQSLMRISYAVFCSNNNKYKTKKQC